jgi:hypothetical protein
MRYYNTTVESYNKIIYFIIETRSTIKIIKSYSIILINKLRTVTFYFIPHLDALHFFQTHFMF